MKNNISPAKLLLVSVTAGCGRDIMDAAKRGGARGGTKIYGRRLLEEEQSAGRCQCDQETCEIVFILMRDEAEEVMTSFVSEGLQDPCIQGAALVIDAPTAMLRVGNADGAADTIGSEPMNSGYTMIASIIPHGHAEALMAAARKAGARGGTVLNALGTGTEEDVKYFGISLAPEKEFLVIVAENSQAGAILEALGSQPVFSEPGGGIIFTTKIERYISLNA